MMQKISWSTYQLAVTSDVVMPAAAVAELLPQLKRQQLNTDRVLDLGTGTGCIALWIRDHYTVEHLTATESTSAALDIAQINCPGIDNAMVSNWWDNIGEQYTLIVCNPPLDNEQNWSENTWAHDQVPKAAVVAGTEGTECLATVLDSAGRYIEMGGHLVLFHTPAQAEYVHTYPHGLLAVGQYEHETLAMSVFQKQPTFSL